MIVIADSGSTKTEWCFVEDGIIIKCIKSKGINPYFESKEEITEKIKQVLSELDSVDKISAIYFYGAGCTPEKREVVKCSISEIVDSNTLIEVNSDLLGAARALFGREKGIACILGTGSNSCYYNGDIIERNISPLGFILGDEGSGAVIGRLFIGGLLKNQFGEELKEQFLYESSLTQGEIIDRVYRKAFPNRFLASLSPHIYKHIDNPSIYNIVFDSFKEFFIRNVMQYDYQTNNIAFIGSIAYYYKNILNEVAQSLNISITKIESSPINGLVKFHSAF